MTEAHLFPPRRWLRAGGRLDFSPTAGRWLARIALVCVVLSVAPALGQAPAVPEPSTMLLRAGDALGLIKTAESAELGRAYPVFLKHGLGGPTPDEGRVLAFEENELFTCFVAGPAKGKEPGEGGGSPERSRWVRRLILLKPGVLLVDDEIVGGGAAKPAVWALQSAHPVVTTGTTTPRFQTTVDGRELVCETLWTGTTAQVAASAAAGGKAATAGSPEQADRGHRAEVRAEGSSMRLIALIHVRPRRSDVPGPRGRVEGKTEGKQAELKDVQSHLLTVTTADRTFRLTLPRWNLGAGDIAVSDAGGKGLLDRRPLPSGVLPHTAEGIKLVERWDSAYRGGRKPGWDIGRAASDLVQAVENGKLRPGRVVELGCGSGTNAIYLAQKGFDVTAIDIAPAAIAMAEEKARKAGVKVRFLVADVLAPPRLEPFDLIFDRGCYHGVRGSSAAGYVEAVRRLSHPGTLLLILAGNANEEPRYGPPRVDEEQLCGDFGKSFDVVELRETRFDTVDPAGKGALAWFALLRRKGKP
jgi:SAM-dependent methyltransferase